jgi:tRNA pseudouridine55 synthase
LDPVRPPPAREMNGIIILDKPAGLTSHDAVVAVRRVVRGTRVGHTGTLDPHATGVLILLLGKATKISRFLMGLEKEYVFTFQLGLETDTLDRWGSVIKVVETPAKGMEDIRNAASALMGRYDQVVPEVSAIKHEGVRLYRLARRGEQVPRKVRTVEIKRFDILEVHHPLVTARVVCSSGTYVRALARDMGYGLGTVASVFSLRRTRIGGFGLEQAVPLADVLRDRTGLEQALVRLGDALRHLPRVRIRSGAVEGLRSGRQPRLEDLSAADLDFVGEFAVLVDDDGQAVAIARRAEDAGRLLATERVL